MDYFKKNIKNYRWVVITEQGYGYLISPSNEKFNFSYFEFFTNQMSIVYEFDMITLTSPNAALNLETDFDFELCELLHAIFKAILKSRIFL